MAMILCLETSTTNCSVSLSLNGKPIALKEDNSSGYSHSEKLHVFIDYVLEEASVEAENLDAIAVSKGPGSFTGLRIGVSAAKGLCFALNIPLIAIDTLALLAAKAVNKYNFIIPLLDARRMEVYTAVYNQEKKVITPIEAKILSKNSFEVFLSQSKTIFIGNGVAKFKEICAHPNTFFLETLPSSKEMAPLAQIKFKENTFEDVAYFEPFYLKDFIC